MRLSLLLLVLSLAGNALLLGRWRRAIRLRSCARSAEKQLGTQIATALGAERYADYQRTTDPSWMTAHRSVVTVRSGQAFAVIAIRLLDNGDRHVFLPSHGEGA